MINNELFSGTYLQSKVQTQCFLATVDEVYADGVTLKIDGRVTQKHYLTNVSQEFKRGDRVKVAKISGTYIVEYIIGKPRQEEKI